MAARGNDGGVLAGGDVGLRFAAGSAIRRVVFRDASGVLADCSVRVTAARTS
jgi:hypothetical protein